MDPWKYLISASVVFVVPPIAWFSCGCATGAAEEVGAEGGLDVFLQPENAMIAMMKQTKSSNLVFI